jgi:hypothetical protein
MIGTFVIPVGDLMHDLAKERFEETEALDKVVIEVRKFVTGELMAASFKKKLKSKQDADEALLNADLKVQQAKQAEKDKLAKKVVTTSINDDESTVALETGDLTEGLLGADADEETRMSARVAEKAASTEGT